MKDHIKRLIDNKISQLPKSNHNTYDWKPNKIRFPKWWPKALDVNLWGDTPERRIDQLVTAAAMIHVEIERLETMRLKKEYEIWVEGPIPVLIGRAVARTFSEAVESFVSDTGNFHGITRITAFSFNSKAEWNNRKSDWEINGSRLFQTREECERQQ